MRFGLTQAERMERYRAPQGEAWRNWFAWYPVRLDRGFGRIAWLEVVKWRWPFGETCYSREYQAIESRR